MQWLIPSVIATMTGTIILTFCYFYLYTQDKQNYLKIWTISWGIYFTRYIFLLAMLLWQKNDWLLIGNQLSSFISGTLLLYGTYLFIDKKFPKPIWYLFILGTIWIFISVLNQFSFMVMSLPTFSFLAIIYIWTGFAFYKYSKSRQKEASIVGFTFIAWGIHKANYPFLRPVVWFAPWGYLIAAMLEFLTALGLIIIYFRKTKDESQMAEERYKGLFNSIRDAIVVADTERSIVECNPAFTELFGYSADEIKNKQTRLLYENDAQYIELGGSLEKHYGQKHFLQTVNYKKKNGQIFLGETGVYYLKNLQSETIGFVGFIRDISDRIKAEDLLRKQNYYLEKAQDLGQIGSWELDIANNILVWTDENCRIFGIPPGSVVNYEIFLSKVHPDDRDYVNREWQAGIEGKPYDIEHRLLLDGEVKWVREKADISFDDNGKAVSAIGITQDITLQKQTQIQLRDNEKMYRLLTENATDVIWVLDVEQNIFRYVSPSAEQLLGYTPEEIIENEPSQLFVPSSLEYLESEVPRRLESYRQGERRIFTDVFEQRHKEGHVVLVEVIGKYVLNPDTNRVEAVGVSRDITEKKQLEDRIRQSEKMESIGNLAGGIAHDFNNILSSIIGFTELALDSAPKGSSQRNDLEEVYIAGNRAKELVQQILAFARQSEEKLKPVRLSDILTETLKLIRPSTPTTIDIKATINSTAKLMGNTSQLHQIVMNLCTNAIHSLEKSGDILELSLKDLIIGKDSEPHACDLPSGKYLELTVADNGPGIEPAVMERIFEPYFTTKGVDEGSGMGLAMVKGIVESYSGDIRVKSRPGETSFVIRLPVTTGASIGVVNQTESITSGTERILFVDDEPPIARMGGRMLESLGYTVTMRTSSYDALELFREKPDAFDLVITDMTMPSMTGDVLSIELRKIRRDIPIILCTGYSNKINDEGAKLIGIDAFAYKPFTKPDFAKTIREVLDKKQTSSD